MSKRQKIADCDRRIGKILKVLRDVEAQPRDWTKGRNAWKKRVAIKHGVALQSIYRWRKKYNRDGIAGLHHRKSSRGQPKAWTKEALAFWFGLCLMPQKREMTITSLYKDLIFEAQLRGWHIGCFTSARRWLREKALSLLENKP